MGVTLDLDLSGQVVAVTGASSGIGEATALACARAGAAVALGVRRADRIEALAARIGQEGGTALALPADVADEAQATAFVRDAAERLGRLDVLVNNAGVMLLGPIEDAPLEEWRRMVDVNVLGLLYCTHTAFPIMKAQGTGHIVNISSVAGRRARAGSAVYNLTKFGVGAFSEALRQEAAAHGIRVSLVEPGAVDTELLDHIRPEIREQAKARRKDSTPLSSEDIAMAILYALAQPQHVDVYEVLIRTTDPAP
jgi:clavulanate-9-aldehyde reducatase